MIWGFRIGGPFVAVSALGLILKLNARVDLECDYLSLLSDAYFNRDGFCFACGVTAVDGIAYAQAYFQSQYDKPSHGRIALRPARGFFLTRAKIDGITFDIECPPGGFGYARIPMPIAEKFQGKPQSFEVGASVQYPLGKGQRIRFCDGILIRSNTNFGNSFGTALTIAGAATGSIVLSKPAMVTMNLPSGVAEVITADFAAETQTLWQMGAPDLENVA